LTLNQLLANELEDWLKKQETIESRILALRKTMNALATLITQHEGPESDFNEYAHARVHEMLDTNMTDDILQIVTASNVAMTASEVMNELKEIGGMNVQANPLATVHAVLNRLAEQEKLKETVKDGRKAWTDAVEKPMFLKVYTAGNLQERKRRKGSNLHQAFSNAVSEPPSTNRPSIGDRIAGKKK
jgi:Fe2+ or Zn2+ uptake regulation protein